MYQVEHWNKWEYPAYWDYKESFDTLEEARDYIKNNPGEDYRIIEEHPIDQA